MAGGAAALGYLRKKAPENAPVFAYGLFGGVCIAVLMFVITGRSLLSKPPADEVVADNIEQHIKTWADNLAMSLERQPPSDAKYFDYIGRFHGGDPIDIFRAKEKPGYLQLTATIGLSPEHQAHLAKMSKQESTQFINGVALELSKLKMGTGIGFTTDINGNVTQVTEALQKAVPISNLNEGYFSQSFDDVSTGVAEMRAATNLAMGTAPFEIPHMPQPSKQPRSQ